MKSTLANYIEKLRLEREWSVSELARQAGLNYSTVSNIETGQVLTPRFDVVIALAKAFGVPIVKFATAYAGQDPDIVTPDNQAEAEKVLDDIIAAAFRRRGLSPPK